MTAIPKSIANIYATTFVHHTTLWCEELSKHDSIRVFTPRFASDLPAYERKNGLEIVRFHTFIKKPPTNMNGLERLVFFLEMLFHCCIFQRRYPSRIIHAFSAISSGTPALLVSKLFSVKLIIHSLGSDVRRGSNDPIMRFWIRNNLHQADLVFSCSAEIHQIIRDKFNIDSIIIPNSINLHPRPTETVKGNHPLATFFSTIEKGFIVLFSAYRLDDFKNPMFLLRNAPRLLEHCEDLHIVFTGVGHLIRDMRTFIQRHGLHNNVHLIGRIPYHLMAFVFHRSDVAAFLSGTENFGSVALLEAASNDCLIVASDAGFTSTLIMDQETGLLIEPDDDSSLIASIEFAYDNPENRSQMIGNLKKRLIEEYDVTAVMSEVYKQYRDLTENS